MKLALHACCGPCSLEPVRLLAEAGHDISICFANSNIQPRAEYDQRLETLRAWAVEAGIAVVDLPYDEEAWRTQVGAIEEARAEAAGAQVDADGATEAQVDAAGAAEATGAQSHAQADNTHVDRCRACYALRLEQAAAWAAAHGFEALSTTLAVSPYQLSDVCHEELEAAAQRHGLACIWEDFRPYYPTATQRSRDLGMYRQNYCGCLYSKAEAEAERAARKAQKAAAQHARETELEAARAERATKQAAFEETQRRKREIRNSFRH